MPPAGTGSCAAGWATGSAAGAESALEKQAYGKVFWRHIPFLMLCYVVAYLDRVNVGFAKLQMAQDLRIMLTELWSDWARMHQGLAAIARKAA